MRPLFAIAAVAGWISLPALSRAADDIGEPLSPAPFLLQDPAVQKELALTREQQSALTKFIEDCRDPLWKFRDVPGNYSRAEAVPFNATMQKSLRAALRTEQFERLEQIGWQWHGARALLLPRLAEQLELRPQQRQRVARVVSDTQNSLRELGRQNLSEKERGRQFEKLRTTEAKLLQNVLTTSQQRAYQTALGPMFDARLQPFVHQAPPLKGLDTWINSPPLSLDSLRGRVVVLHFWTFGCENCQHNLPHYQSWQSRFASKPVTILGIHTPETDGERVVANVQKQVRALEIAYPVAIDNQAQSWNSWNNGIWPAIYLIDKQGRVRYWHYGELNWEGAPTEQFFRGKIEELANESAEPDAANLPRTITSDR
jgi:thiol-disulfide isomerase/thioredoxin